MSLAQEPLQLGNPCLILASVSVACKCPFWILGKLRSPSTWQTRMNAVFAGNLGKKRLAGLKLGGNY